MAWLHLTCSYDWAGVFVTPSPVPSVQGWSRSMMSRIRQITGSTFGTYGTAQPIYARKMPTPCGGSRNKVCQ